MGVKGEHAQRLADPQGGGQKWAVRQRGWCGEEAPRPCGGRGVSRGAWKGERGTGHSGRRGSGNRRVGARNAKAPMAAAGGSSGSGSSGGETGWRPSRASATPSPSRQHTASGTHRPAARCETRKASPASETGHTLKWCGARCWQSCPDADGWPHGDGAQFPRDSRARDARVQRDLLGGRISLCEFKKVEANSRLSKQLWVFFPARRVRPRRSSADLWRLAPTA